MKRLLAYLKPHKWVMTAATVLVLFIIVVELYRPIVIGDAIDDYINGYYAPYIETTADAPGAVPYHDTYLTIRFFYIIMTIIWQKIFHPKNVMH